MEPRRARKSRYANCGEVEVKSDDGLNNSGCMFSYGLLIFFQAFREGSRKSMRMKVRLEVELAFILNCALLSSTILIFFLFCE